MNTRKTSGLPTNRVESQTFTPEFLREFCGVDPEKCEDRFEQAARRIERNYDCVAWFSKDKRHSGYRDSSRAYTLYVLRTRDADDQTMRRALDEATHWIDVK